MSQRYDISLISGAQVYGVGGLGVLGAVILATTGTGSSGAGYLFNDVDAGDEGKEFQGEILVPPAAGVFTANEDGTFILTGAPDGTYAFSYQGKADGVVYGTSISSSISIGAGSLASVSGAGGIGSSEAVGSPTVTTIGGTAVGITGAGGIASSEAFGTPTVTTQSLPLPPSTISGPANASRQRIRRGRGRG